MVKSRCNDRLKYFGDSMLKVARNIKRGISIVFPSNFSELNLLNNYLLSCFAVIRGMDSPHYFCQVWQEVCTTIRKKYDNLFNYDRKPRKVKMARPDPPKRSGPKSAVLVHDSRL
ncbi:hypothetical protein ISCGN_003816 [Ixodes scapularis]